MTAYKTMDEAADTLWVNDAEMIRRMGVPEKVARDAIRMLDSKPSGFPRKQALWGNRRYWPAIRAYLDKHNGLTLDANRSERHDR